MPVAASQESDSQAKKPSQELQKYSTFVKPIRQGVLAASQFPFRLQDANGKFHKPNSW
jgi:hypothetical protein